MSLHSQNYYWERSSENTSVVDPEQIDRAGEQHYQGYMGYPTDVVRLLTVVAQ